MDALHLLLAFEAGMLGTHDDLAEQEMTTAQESDHF